MRQVTQQIVDAFLEGRNLKVGNSRSFDGAIYLHNNKIAEYRADGLWITNAGWMSNTTKERLNGLPFVRINQYNFTWFLNGQQWDGSWKCVAAIPNPNWFHLNFREPAPLLEPEFDLSSEWIANGGYSKPVYSVWHSNVPATLRPIEASLDTMGIKHRRMESDTQGVYKPNYFVVVRPEDFNKVLTKIS
jgi:hypothetical protein